MHIYDVPGINLLPESLSGFIQGFMGLIYFLYVIAFIRKVHHEL